MTENRCLALVGCAAMIIALVSATDHASSWNDASRLATVECLVDHRSWSIDESIFVKSSAPAFHGRHPFGDHAAAFPNGTMDKLLIDGKFYSDKSPVPALYMAAWYTVWRTCGGPTAAERPNWFCWWMTVTSVGFAFIATAMCLMAIAGRVGLPMHRRLLAVMFFTLGSVALPYVRSANNHEMLLCITAGLVLALDKSSLFIAGTLAGIAYTIDLGAGPVFAAGAAGYVIVRHYRSPGSVLSFIIAMLLWLIFHHALNYHIGGTWRPANANPEYLQWPGSPFSETSMSGGWHHQSAMGFVGYAIDLLGGKKGFWNFNLPLLIAVPGLVANATVSKARRPMIVLCWTWCIGVWLIYAAGSTNFSGACISVRWYVPLIAPLSIITLCNLNERPRLFAPFLWLGTFGMAINLSAWTHGPWYGKTIEGFWLMCICGIGGAYWLWSTSSGKTGRTLQLSRAA